jgi:type VI protein secretion system component VasK
MDVNDVNKKALEELRKAAQNKAREGAKPKPKVRPKAEAGATAGGDVVAYLEKRLEETQERLAMLEQVLSVLMDAVRDMADFCNVITGEGDVHSDAEQDGS